MPTTKQDASRQNPGQPGRTGAAQGDGLALAMSRNTFYRDAFERVTRQLFVVGLVAAGSLCLNIAQFVWRPAPAYFAIDAQNRLIPLAPMSRPHASTDRVISFARDHAMLALSHDFANYRSQLAHASKWFTTEGFSNFLGALETAGTLGRMEKEQFVSVPVPTGAGVIAEEGDVGGVYRWIVEQPALLTLQGRGGVVIPNKVVLRIVVERVDVRDRPEGMAISRLQATPV